MPDGNNDKAETFIRIFRNILGGGLLCFMLYVHALVSPIDIWLFIFPGILLDFPVKEFFGSVPKVK